MPLLELIPEVADDAASERDVLAHASEPVATTATHDLCEELCKAVDDASTLEDAARAVLTRVCWHTTWSAGRAHLTGVAPVWHVASRHVMPLVTSFAKQRRRGQDEAIPQTWTARRDGPLWTFGFALDRVAQSYLEFFSTSRWARDDAMLDELALAFTPLGALLRRKPAEKSLRRSEQDYRTLFDLAPDAIFVVEPEDRVVLDANRNAAELLRSARGDLLGRPIEALLGRTADLERALFAGGAVESDLLLGDRCVTAVASHAELSGLRVILLALRDVTARRQAEQALHVVQERERDLFYRSPVPCFIYDRATLAIRAANDAALEQYGYSFDELTSMTMRGLLGESSELAVPPGLETLRLIHRRRDGRTMHVELRAHDHDAGGVPVRVAVAYDISDRVDNESRLEHAAFTDALTGLHNRAAFMKRLATAVARARTGSLFALLFLDLDRFKLVNDSLGHATGDALLVEIARRLRSQLRASDFAARLGGDEFTILLPIQEPAEALRIAERVQRAVSQPFVLDGHELYASASTGVAFLTQNARNSEDVLRDADTAMYRAKAAGPGQVTVFDETMHLRASEMLRLESELRRAFERNELLVYFQPIVSLLDGRVRGFEALSRWKHAEQGFIPPSKFIPVAEETGLITRLGEWVLQRACLDLTALRGRRRPTLSVNLSARQLQHPGLVDDVWAMLETTGFDPAQLQLEVTESVLVEHGETATRTLAQLRARGIRIAMDDFGTGYSSLSYLHKFPLDAIKLDQSFVRALHSDDRIGQIVHTVVMLGRNLGLELIAEGVETEAQAKLLRDMGCDYAQGFLYAPALPAADAALLLR